MQKKFYILLLVFFTALPTLARAPFERGVVVSKNPIASQIGANILNNGGNAIDAAIGTAYGLGVVEPQGSGLGGGGFALIYLAKSNQLKAIDFRERGPEKINQFPYEFKDGPSAGGVPGTVAGLEYLRKNYGKLQRQEILESVIQLAERGFLVNETLSKAITRRANTLTKFPSSKNIFLANNTAPLPGDMLIQKDLAQTLKLISEKGETEFYHGDLARRIVKGLNDNGGFLTLKDLETYKVKELKPICGDYRGQEEVCSFPLPSSGGICLIETLNILDNFDMPHLDYKSSERLHYLIEALKFSFADRATKLGDPQFNKVPVSQLTSQSYANRISSHIQWKGASTPSKEVLKINNEKPETTHLTVADRDGNIVVITASLNGGLGSGFAIPGTGILFNNTLDDFSLPSSEPNQYGLIGNNLNAPAPGKTPLSSMSPTIVFNKKGKPILALGSPGGPTIISAVLNTLLAYFDNQMNITEAVAAGRVHHQWMPDHVYAEDWIIDKSKRELLTKDYGYYFPSQDEAIWKEFYWTVQAVELDWKNSKLTGASDPRKEQGLVYEEAN